MRPYSRSRILRTRNQLVRRSSALYRSLGVSCLARWAFYGFVFSLPFETADIGLPYELPKIIGGFLLLAAFFQPRVCLRRPPAAFWCFAGYLLVCGVWGFFWEAGYWEEVTQRLYTLFQLLVLFWIAYNLLRYDRIAKNALLTLTVSCVMLSALQLSGLMSTVVDVGSGAERISALGENPNRVAGLLALGLLTLIGLTYNLKNESRLQFLFIVWPVVTLLGITIVKTGSRGGLLALGAGLLIFIFRSSRTAWSRFRNALVVLIGLGFLGWVSYQSESTRTRFEETLETGSMARRELVYPTAWQMIQQKPFTGWGPVNNTYELGDRLQHPDEPKTDTHNLFLYVLTATGVVGAIPFVIGIWLCLQTAWTARAGAHGILPFALAVALLTANMSGTWLHFKLHWLVLAYALASSHFIGRGLGRAIARVTRPSVIMPVWRHKVAAAR